MIDDQLIAGFFRAVNEHNTGEMSDLFSEDTEFNFPKTQPLIGKEMVLRFFKILFRQYPELFFNVERTIIEGNQAAVHWTNRGKSRKGDPYENEGVTIFEENDGRIIYMSDFFKDTGKF
jgi:steroid delta-isomerase-like uncharacterized protein